MASDAYWGAPFACPAHSAASLSEEEAVEADAVAEAEAEAEADEDTAEVDEAEEEAEVGEVPGARRASLLRCSDSKTAWATASFSGIP